ncbi:MAG TPA: nitroreductase [Eubacteriaceae bacterium]|jgi:nitroreductase|nr:nitroreductase [Eubacteriaceae bacterium]
MNNRNFNYDIMPEIKERWSSRAFSDKKIKTDDLMAVLEAASFAPSCFNEQPWRFVIGDTKQSKEKLCGLLYEGNQKWACNAPVLILVLSYKYFSSNSKDNYWHMFDTGTSWGYLSLEAWRRGILAHAMGGFSRKRTREELNISEDYDIVTIIAVGYPGDKTKLPEDLQDREHPAVRKPLSSLILDIDESGKLK